MDLEATSKAYKARLLQIGEERKTIEKELIQLKEEDKYVLTDIRY